MGVAASHAATPERLAVGGTYPQPLTPLPSAQPGLHIVTDSTGKERCPSSLLARGASGTYWHYHTQLPVSAGESIIYNVAGAANHTKLRGALEAMCATAVCEEPEGL